MKFAASVLVLFAVTVAAVSARPETALQKVETRLSGALSCTAVFVPEVMEYVYDWFAVFLDALGKFATQYEKCDSNDTSDIGCIVESIITVVEDNSVQMTNNTINFIGQIVTYVECLVL